MNAITRTALINWWLEQNTAVLRKISSRYLPARLSRALHTIQTRYAIPTVVIAPATGSLTLLPQTPGEAPSTPLRHLRAWRISPVCAPAASLRCGHGVTADRTLSAYG
ncbi:hypothetical protein [Acetobacter persici]|uniref:hypothetical protein n=1 Tax=Acetobacter persici TaxID=1076596 RepID=UPI0012FE7BEF|nr:hypothetical protein [Acetobacter persici]